MVDFIMDRSSCKYWLDTHFLELNRYIQLNFHCDDYDFKLQQFYNNPIVAKAVIEDSKLRNDFKYDQVLKFLSRGSLIVLVMGMRGMGKSCTVHKICVDLVEQYNREVFVIGPPMDYDKRFNHAYDIYDTPEGSINIIDESSLLANSRKSGSMQNIGLTEVLPTLRHVGKTIFCITQNSAMTDLQFIRLCDCLIFKKYSLLQKVTERDEMIVFNMYSPKRIDEVLFCADNFITKFIHKPDVAWCDELSRCYRSIKDEEEAVSYAKSLFEQDYDLRSIRGLLRVKGFKQPLTWYKDLLENKH